MAKKAPRSRAKQGALPTMEPPSIPEIDAAADRYLELRNDRMTLTPQEKEARELLEHAMRQHDLQVYEYDGKIVQLNTTAKASVRSKKDEANGDEGDDEPCDD